MKNSLPSLHDLVLMHYNRLHNRLSSAGLQRDQNPSPTVTIIYLISELIVL